MQLGDPKAIYPQIAKNAEYRAKAYAAWKERTGGTAEDDTGVLSQKQTISGHFPGTTVLPGPSYD